jgi:adenylosuccinate lyase
MFEHRDIADPSGVRARIEEIFSERATVERVLRFETVIAGVQARFGIVPQVVAEEIGERGAARFVPADAVARRLQQVGHPMVAILDAWAERLSPEAAEWIHYGATTADVLRTVQFMQLRDVADVLDEAMHDIEQCLGILAAQHRATPMVGRTLGRHALPITFGFKIAIWLCELRRSRERLRAWRAGTRGGVFSGALGTYSILGGRGPQIEAAVLEQLDLGAPEFIDIKGSFDRYAEFGSVLAIASKTCGRIGQEIFLLQGDDIRELAEVGSAVGSSTMPHKSNPTLSIEVVSKSREVAAMLPVLLDWMLVIHERDSAHHDDLLARMCIDFAQLLSCMGALVRRLRVFPDNMLRNIGRTGGLVATEALTQRLAPRIGRRSAHAALHGLARRAAERGESLFSAIDRDPQMSELLRGVDRADAMADGGQASCIVDRVLAALGIPAEDSPGAAEPEVACAVPRPSDV